MLEFQKISIKMKNCKPFYEVQTASCLKDINRPPPNPQPTTPPPPSPSSPSDKILVRLWKKNVLMEIYRNIQTFAFRVLQKCSSFASRNGAAQMFFWHQAETCLLENLWSQKGFWPCCGRILFSMSCELRFLKWVRSFERNCIVKWVIFFASFYWLCDFLLENMKIKKNSDDVHWNVWANTKALHALNNIFKKRILNMRLGIIYILVQISVLGTALRAF